MRMKKRIFSGAVCEQIVYSIPDRVKDPTKAKPKIEYKDVAERQEHLDGIAKRKFIRLVNTNFTPAGYFATLTLDKESECHTFDEARMIRRNFVRRLLYKYPDTRMVMVMGRGKSTSRIHFHLIIEGEGITAEAVTKAWKDGEIAKISHLRAHNTFDGKDLGQDYTQLATYLIDHWKPEQGGHRFYGTRNLKQPDAETPTVCARNYSAERPPITPKGYEFISCTWTRYGYMIFKYNKKLEKNPRRKQAP